MNRVLRVCAVATAIVLLLGTALATANGPGIQPSEVEGVLRGGESMEVDKRVTTPAIPPIVEVCLLEDETGSFADDIGNLQGGTTASDIYDNVVAATSVAKFAVAGFRDYPTWPYGGGGDWVYRLLSAMSPVKANWLNGIAALSAGGGADTPEAQYDAIVAAVLGGFGYDPCGFDPDPLVTKVLVVATDAPFHTPDGTHVNDYTSTVGVLQAAGVRVVGLKAPGAGGELDALAGATGGSVQPLSPSGANIAAAILAGLSNLPVDVEMATDCTDPIMVSFDPPEQTVTSGDPAYFVETIALADYALPGVYECRDWALINGEPMRDENGETIYEYKTITVPAMPVDIKPQSCPNPLNVKDKGVIPVAILGTEDFDVAAVDPASVMLAGVSPLRWDWEDVATPFDPWFGREDCFEDCWEEGPDGYMDLTVKFDAQEVVAALGEVEDGDCLRLHVTAKLKAEYGGWSFVGEDVVWIKKKGK
jgi:hypothetical protein